MKRFFFLLFALLFIGVGIEAKTVPAYLDGGSSEFVINDHSEGLTIGETMAMLDLDFYIFQTGYGARLATTEIGEYKLLPFLDVQTEGVLYDNSISYALLEDPMIWSIQSQEQREYEVEQIHRGFGIGQINRFTINTDTFRLS